MTEEESTMASIKCCRDCKSRFPACHDFCSKYKAEKAEIEAAKEAERKERQITAYYFQKKYKHTTVRYVNSTAKRSR